MDYIFSRLLVINERLSQDVIHLIFISLEGYTDCNALYWEQICSLRASHDVLEDLEISRVQHKCSLEGLTTRSLPVYWEHWDDSQQEGEPEYPEISSGKKRVHVSMNDSPDFIGILQEKMEDVSIHDDNRKHEDLIDKYKREEHLQYNKSCSLKCVR
jgi:hypothetical protein